MKVVKINTPVKKFALRLIHNDGYSTVSIQTTSKKEYELLKMVSESLMYKSTISKPRMVNA